MSALSEQEFRVRCDEALDGVQEALLPLADAEEFEVEFQNGVLNVIFEEPRDAKFVVSPQAPVRQMWVSAMSRSFKLQWDADRSAFVLGDEALADLLKRLCREFLAS
jgi:CyaY protein